MALIGALSHSAANSRSTSNLYEYTTNELFVFVLALRKKLLDEDGSAAPPMILNSFPQVLAEELAKWYAKRRHFWSFAPHFYLDVGI